MHDHSLEGHTIRRYDGELNQLHLKVLEMGGLVQNQLSEALEALRNLDSARARKVTRTDQAVDALEIEVDEKVIELAAKRAPLASDLRMVLVSSKCVTELEEAGDEAVSIAYKILHLCSFEALSPEPGLVNELGRLAEPALEMLTGALEAYDRLEESKADRVIARHRSLQLNYRSELRQLVSLDMHDPRLISQVVDIALIARSLEAIGRHAKKIAEHVIFFVHGEDIRHSKA